MSSCTSFSHFLCHYQNTCVCVPVYIIRIKLMGGYFLYYHAILLLAGPLIVHILFPIALSKSKKNTTYIRVCLLTAPHPQLARAITQWVGMCISPCGHAHPTT